MRPIRPEIVEHGDGVPMDEADTNAGLRRRRRELEQELTQTQERLQTAHAQIEADRISLETRRDQMQAVRAAVQAPAAEPRREDSLERRLKALLDTPGHPRSDDPTPSPGGPPRPLLSQVTTYVDAKALVKAMAEEKTSGDKPTILLGTGVPASPKLHCAVVPPPGDKWAFTSTLAEYRRD